MLFEQLDKKLEEQRQMDLEKEANLELRSRKKLTRAEKQAAEKISSLAEHNAIILFGDMDVVDGVHAMRTPEQHQAAALEDLRRRERTADYKERKRLQAQREEIERDGIQRVRERIEQQLDDQMATALRAEKTDYTPDFYGDTLERMKVNACGDRGVPPQERHTHLEQLRALQDQSAALRRRYAATVVVGKVLQKKLGESAQKYIARKMDVLTAERTAFDEAFQRCRDDYNTAFHGTLAGDKQVERYHQRAATYQQVSGATAAQAEQEMQRRAIEPPTLRQLPQVLSDYKKRTQRYALKKSSEGDTVYDVPYPTQMDEVMDTVNRKLKALYPAAPPITQAEAETLAKRLLQDLLAKNDYRFRCGAAVFGLIADDKMKTQMETGTSGGAKNAPLRMKFTEKSFGNTVGSLDPTEYENYGYLSSPEDALINRSKTAGYGSVAVKLSKERMAGRVTCTVGDSLNKILTTTPSSVDDPDLACVAQETKAALILSAYQKYTAGQDVSDDVEHMLAELNKELNKGEKGAEYLELQYHGDVTVRDMEEVIVSFPPVLRKEKADGSGESFDEALERVKGEYLRDLKTVQKKVYEINQNPAAYGRTGLPPLRLKTVVGAGEHTQVAVLKSFPDAKEETAP